MAGVNQPPVPELKSLSYQVVDDVLNGEDPGAIGHLVSADLVVHGLDSDSEISGRDAFEKELDAWRRAVPNSEDVIESSVGEGDTVVLFCTRRGTLESAYPGIPAAAIGNTFAVPVVHRFRFEDGRVVEWWRLADGLGMARQLGVLPDSLWGIVRLAVGGLRHRLTS